MAVSPLAWGDEGPATTAELGRLVEIALADNPQLSAIQAQVDALEQRTTLAGAWQNPKLAIAYQNAPIDSLAMGVEPMTMVTVRVEQTIPFFGKTRDRKGVVRKATAAKRWELQEKRNELKALVATAYYRLALSRHLHSITADHVTLVEQLIDAVRIKYEVGRAQQENLLRLQVLRDRLRDDIDDFVRQDSELSAAINAALHRDPRTTISTPDHFSLSAPIKTLQELREVARKHRPTLRQLALTAEMHRAAADLAKSEAMPDPTVFAGYGIRTELDNGSGGRDLLTIGISVPLPVFYNSRNVPQSAESLAQARAVEATRAAVHDSIDAGLGQAMATWSRAASKVKTYRDHLVPAARRTLEATLSSYTVDRADFLSLYETEVDLLDFERTIRIATVDGLVAQTAVERIIGSKL